MDAQDAVGEALFGPKCNMQLINYRFEWWVLRKSVCAMMLRQSMVGAKAVNKKRIWIPERSSVDAKACCNRILQGVAKRYDMQ